MPSSYTRTYVDQSNEKSAFTAWVQQINAANYTSITDTLLPALGAALASAGPAVGGRRQIG